MTDYRRFFHRCFFNAIIWKIIVLKYKFKIWFQHYAEMEEFEFVSELMDVGDDEYFTAMILKSSHPHLTSTVDAFHQYFHDLRGKLD